MRHVNHRRAQVALKADELDPQHLAQLGIQIGQGFVHQKKPGLACYGAANGNALHLPARQVRGGSIQKRRDAEQGRGVGNAVSDFRFREVAPGREQWKFEILAHGLVGIQGKILKDQSHVAFCRQAVRHIHPLDDNAPGIRHFEARDDPQQRGLARASWPQNDQQFPRIQGKKNV